MIARRAILRKLFPVLLALVCGCATPVKRGPQSVSAVPTAKASGSSSAKSSPAATIAGPALPNDTATLAPQAPAVDAIRKIGLNEAIQIVIDSNLDLSLTQAQHEVAESRLGAARNALLPSLDLGGGISRTDGLVQGSFGDFRDVSSRSVTVGAGIGLRANIPARVCEAIASRHELAASVLDTISSEQKLLLNVIELYENLLLAKTGMDVSKQLVESSEEFERITSKRYDAGVGLGSDAARAQTNLAASRQQFVQAENLWHQTSVRLAVVLRLAPETLLDPADTQLASWQLPDGANFDVYAKSASGRPDINAAREQAVAEEIRTRARWWDLVAPDLTVEWRVSGIGGNGAEAGPDRRLAASNAVGSVGRSLSAWQNAAATPSVQSLSGAAGSAGRAYYNYRNTLGSVQQHEDDLDSQERYGVWLNWNLSFAKLDRMREQRAAAMIAGLRAEKAQEAAVGEVRTAQHDIQSALQLVALAYDEIKAAEDNHRMSLARFTAGTAIAFEVLDAQDTLAEARLKLARYTAAMNIAQARLLTAAGLITERFPAVPLDKK